MFIMSHAICPLHSLNVANGVVQCNFPAIRDQRPPCAVNSDCSIRLRAFSYLATVSGCLYNLHQIIICNPLVTQHFANKKFCFLNNKYEAFY